MNVSFDAVAQQAISQTGNAAPQGHMQALGDKFGAMMNDVPDAARFNDADRSARTSLGGELVAHEESAMRETFQKVQALQHDAPSLSMQDFAARQMEVAMHVAAVQFQFNACAQVAQSSKNGIQTLVKNQ